MAGICASQRDAACAISRFTGLRMPQAVSDGRFGCLVALALRAWSAYRLFDAGPRLDRVCKGDGSSHHIHCAARCLSCQRIMVPLEQFGAVNAWDLSAEWVLLAPSAAVAPCLRGLGSRWLEQFLEHAQTCAFVPFIALSPAFIGSSNSVICWLGLRVEPRSGSPPTLSNAAFSRASVGCGSAWPTSLSSMPLA